MLDRDAVMRQLVPHGADDPGLRISPLDRADAGGTAQRRCLAVAGGDELADELPPVAQESGRGGGVALHPLDRNRGQMPEIRQCARPLDLRAAQRPVLDDIAQGRGAEIAMVVMQKQRRIAVGDADFENRLGFGGDQRPKADALQHLLRAIGNGGGAAVEGFRQHRGGILAVDDRDLDPGMGAGDAEGEAGKPAANHDELDPLLRHGAKDAAQSKICPSPRAAAGLAAQIAPEQQGAHDQQQAEPGQLKVESPLRQRDGEGARVDQRPNPGHAGD